MRSPQVNNLAGQSRAVVFDHPQTVRGGHTDLRVLQSAAGLYIGTLYQEFDVKGSLLIELPGSRDSGYCDSAEAAARDLADLEADHPEDPQRSGAPARPGFRSHADHPRLRHSPESSPDFHRLDRLTSRTFAKASQLQVILGSRQRTAVILPGSGEAPGAAFGSCGVPCRASALTGRGVSERYPLPVLPLRSGSPHRAFARR